MSVSVSAGAGEQGADSAARKPRALAPGSFLRHMLGSKNTASQQPFSDLEITAQAFIFLLAGERPLSHVTPSLSSRLAQAQSEIPLTI